MSDASTPRGRLERVPPSVRHLWSLLYRATRRHAVRVDRLSDGLDRLARSVESSGARVARLYGFVTEVTAVHRRGFESIDARLTALEARVAALEVSEDDS